MDGLPDREVEAIARDDVSGATDLTLRAADLLLWALANGHGERAARRLLHAKPMMASLLNLAVLALQDDAEEAAAKIWAFRDGLARAPVQAARAAVAYLADKGEGMRSVLTVSASRAVEETILALAEAGKVSSVVVAESRPRLEGEAMARRLLGRVPSVAVTHDAALPGLCSPESLVLLGADAVLPEAFVNKAGSLALCLAAREVQATRLVVTTSHKVLSRGATPFFRLPTAPEVHNPAPDSPGFLDIQFDQVPRRLVQAVVTEDGPSAWKV